MMNKGRREKQCFFPGPFFPAHRTFLTTLCALLVFPLFLSPALAATAPFDETILAEVQALQELKEKQPAVYQQRIHALKDTVKKDVGNWRTQKPEVYQRFMQRSQARIQHHREFLRQKRPDLYPVYQKRQEQRENYRETHRSAAPRESAHPNPEPVRPSFENRETRNRQQNLQPSFSQPSRRQPRPSSREGLAERPRINAGNDPRKRTARVENKPGLSPRQQGSFINSQERPRNRPPNSQGFSRQSRQERPKPRDSRQRS